MVEAVKVCRDCHVEKGKQHSTWCMLEMQRKLQYDAWEQGLQVGMDDFQSANVENPYEHVSTMWRDEEEE